MAQKNFVLMSKITEEQKQRLYKPCTEPIRKIMLWGKDKEENHCLLVLYGKHEFDKPVKHSERSYYAEAYLLKPDITYTHYAVFHGNNKHFPSIPNTYYRKEQELLCYKKGYRKAKRRWDYDRETRRYCETLIVNDRYIVKEFYQMEKDISLDYYQNLKYEDYVNVIQSNGVTFEDFEIIEDPSTLFGVEKDSIYYDMVYNMFSKQKLYTRIKKMNELIKSNPPEEVYESILNVASVEIACGIFQQLTIDKNPILLKKAKEIKSSKELWAKKEYHNGLIRFVKNYINVFDEKLIQKQKEWIYQTLPEMDFHITRLKVYGEAMTGKELQEYMENFGSYIYNNTWLVNYGREKLYHKNTYTDGTNIKNIAFKNTLQMVKAYDMPDALGKIAYYIDAPRTSNYFKRSGKTGAYNYYQRYIRRIFDNYKATDETKFIEAARVYLSSWQEGETYNSCAYFFYHFFEGEENSQIWNRHIEDVMYIVKNTTDDEIFDFCYEILKKPENQNQIAHYDIKELIILSQIPHTEIAQIFEKLLMPKLKALTTFDAEIMLTLMNMKSEVLQNTAKEYFKNTHGKFSPQDIANILCLDTIENWYEVVKTNIDVFRAEEYIAFTKALTEKSEYFITMQQQQKLPENIVELLQNSVEKLQYATMAQKQKLIENFANLILSNVKIPDFIYDMAESILFCMSYEQLKEAFQSISFEHGALTEKKRNTIAVAQSIQQDSMIKDSVILSILDIGSARLVKMLTEVIQKQRQELIEKPNTLLLLFECNVYALNQTAQTVFENMEQQKREKMHMMLLDSPVESVYQYGLKKLEEWYGDKIPQQFISRMLEHTCIVVKQFLSKKMEKAFYNLEYIQPDLYIYYAKTLLYLPNKATKSKEYIYNSMTKFLHYHPQKRKEIEEILIDIGSTNVKINAERALVAFAQIQKEEYTLCK